MKNNIKHLSKVTLLILLLSLTGCYYNEVVDQSDLPPINTEVSFSQDIQPILNDNCVVCHDGTLDPNLTEGNSYTSLTGIPGGIVAGDASSSELIDMLEHDPAADNPMPPAGPIATSKIDLIKAWINQGALNN
ncbi:MAG: hypothetical protein ACWA42_02775 [Lutibacter sp.]